MSTLLLEIVTPERMVYSKNVNIVTIRGVEGEMGILPNHIPMVTPLKISAVTAKFDGKLENIAVSGGFARNSPRQSGYSGGERRAACAISTWTVPSWPKSVRKNGFRMASRMKSIITAHSWLCSVP